MRYKTDTEPLGVIARLKRNPSIWELAGSVGRTLVAGCADDNVLFAVFEVNHGVKREIVDVG
jgi:hypothetical protein